MKENVFGPPILNLEVRDYHRHKSHCLVEKVDMIDLNHKHIVFFEWHICQCIVV